MRPTTTQFPVIELLRTTEVAKLLGVSPRTVLAWTKAGKIPSILTPGGNFGAGHRRYSPAAVAAARLQMQAAGDKRAIPQGQPGGDAT